MSTGFTPGGDQQLVEAVAAARRRKDLAQACFQKSEAELQDAEHALMQAWCELRDYQDQQVAAALAKARGEQA